jgi:hypothetical protein
VTASLPIPHLQPLSRNVRPQSFGGGGSVRLWMGVGVALGSMVESVERLGFQRLWRCCDRL